MEFHQSYSNIIASIPIIRFLTFQAFFVSSSSSSSLLITGLDKPSNNSQHPIIVVLDIIDRGPRPNLGRVRQYYDTWRGVQFLAGYSELLQDSADPIEGQWTIVVYYV